MDAGLDMEPAASQDARADALPAELVFRARLRLVASAHPRAVALLAPLPERARTALLAQLIELGAQAWTGGAGRRTPHPATAIPSPTPAAGDTSAVTGRSRPAEPAQAAPPAATDADAAPLAAFAAALAARAVRRAG